MTRGVCRRMGLLFALLVACSLAVPVMPLEAGQKDEAGEGEGRREAFAGMTVSVDPETGRVRPPSVEEAKKLRAAMRDIVAQLRASRRAPGTTAAAPAARSQAAAPKGVREDGKLSAVVGPDHINFTTAAVGPDGKVSTSCLNADHNHDQAPTPAAPAAE